MKFTQRVAEKTLLKNGEVKKLVVKVYDGGKLVSEDKDVEALLYVCYKKAGKDGFTLSPNVLGHGVGVFEILRSSSSCEAAIAKSMGFEKELAMAKLMNISETLDGIMAKSKSSKKKASAKKKPTKR